MAAAGEKELYGGKGVTTCATGRRRVLSQDGRAVIGGATARAKGAFSHRFAAKSISTVGYAPASRSWRPHDFPSENQMVWAQPCGGSAGRA